MYALSTYGVHQNLLLSMHHFSVLKSGNAFSLKPPIFHWEFSFLADSLVFWFRQIWFFRGHARICTSLCSNPGISPPPLQMCTFWVQFIFLPFRAFWLFSRCLEISCHRSCCFFVVFRETCEVSSGCLLISPRVTMLHFPLCLLPVLVNATLSFSSYLCGWLPFKELPW